MTTIYRTNDGEEFTSIDDAVRHEELLEQGKKNRAKIILDTHIANKSKLKAGILKTCNKKLDVAWENWKKVLPKSRFNIPHNKFKEIYDAIYKLESACIQHKLNHDTLNAAKKMIPVFNNVIKSGTESSLDDNALRLVRLVNTW